MQQANQEFYRQRQEITEHQFGTLKRHWHFTHTMVRGKEEVLSEVYLCFSVYNLIRCIKILGMDKLKIRLEKLVLDYLGKNEVVLAVISHFLNTKHMNMRKIKVL